MNIKDYIFMKAMAGGFAPTGGGSGGGSAEGCVTVTFMNGDVELFSRPVYIGDDCPEPVAQGRFDAPTKESTVQYNYTFYGWGAEPGGAADANILKNITEDKTVYAIFAETARLYTITFYDEDGTTVLATKQVAYGTVPSYTPTKDGVLFVGWTPAPVAVTGEASYTATWATATVVFAPQEITTTAWSSGEIYRDVDKGNSDGAKSGEQYGVEWNGKTYVFTAANYQFEYDKWTRSLIGIGNVRVIKKYQKYTAKYHKNVDTNTAVTDTGEPFFVEWNKDNQKWLIWTPTVVTATVGLNLLA